VFGATGNIGRMAVKYLAKEGAQVIIPYRSEERSWAYLKLAGEIGQIVPIRWTIYDKQAIAMAVEQAKIVVNLAGKTEETKNFTYQQANVESAINIATACKAAGVERLIHISAVGVDKNTSSGFLKSKAESEKAVKEIFPDVTILRITTPFGERDRFFFKFGYMINRFPFFLMLGRKDTKFQPVYTADVAKAINAVLTDPNTKGKTFELGGPDVVTFEQFANFVLKYTKYDGMKPIFELSPHSRLSKFISTIMSYTRNSIYTPDELLRNETDNIVNPNALSFKDLGIKPKSMEECVTPFQLFRSKLKTTPV